MTNRVISRPGTTSWLQVRELGFLAEGLRVCLLQAAGKIWNKWVVGDLAWRCPSARHLMTNWSSSLANDEWLCDISTTSLRLFSSSINLLIIFISIHWSKLWKTLITSSQSNVFKVLLVQRTVQNLKNYWFTLINDKERQKIITLKRLQPVKVWYFCAKSDLSNWLVGGKTKTTLSLFSLHLNSFECSGLYFFFYNQLIIAALHLALV